jgi:ADP-heptose:LPS heptosyltransferase
MDLTKRQKFAQRYRFQTLFFGVIDALLSPLSLLSARPHLPQAPQKILIANAGHLGDMVIATAAISVMQKQWPQAEFGLLCANSLKPLESHLVGISHFHYLDHWYTDRSPRSLWKKIVNYFQHSKAVIQEINQQHYDVAIDLRVWFPNFIPLLWRTNIAVRLGSNRVGFSPLLTHQIPFEFDGGHEAAYQLAIVRALIPSVGKWSELRTVLTADSPTANVQLMQWLATHKMLPHIPYRIIHMGSSNALRDWPIARWQELTGSLVAQGHRLIFTGAGDRERANIEKVIDQFPTAINACDALNLSQLLGLLGGAQLVYSVETSVGHIAAALGVPVLALYGGTADPDQWRPLGRVSLITQRLACSPCFMQKGCQSMACIRSIDLVDVQKASEDLLSATHAS